MLKYFSYFLIIIFFFSCGGDTPTANLESVITDKDWKESLQTDRFNLSSTNNVYKSKSAMCEDYLEEGNWLLEGNQLYHVINDGPIETSEHLGTIEYYSEDEIQLLTPADSTIVFLAVDLAVYGCTSETSPNFNPQANCDDGSCNDDILIDGNCDDGILNNGEELIDCGGPNCDPCQHPAVGMWDYIGMNQVPYIGNVTNLENSLELLADSCSANMYLDIQTDGSGDFYLSDLDFVEVDGEFIEDCRDTLVTLQANFINDTTLNIDIYLIGTWPSKLLYSGSVMESHVVIPDVEDGDVNEGYIYWEKQ